MQVSGKILVLTTFAIGFAMAGGAWWYNFQQSSRTAEFWGARDATLIVGSDKVELLELEEPSTESDVAQTVKNVLAGRTILSAIDITTRPGLVHLRHALTYDDNFFWIGFDRNADDDWGWAWALRFSKGDRQLIVLFHRNFGRLGRISENGRIDALPCTELGKVIVEYLTKVGVTLDKRTPAPN